MKKDLNDSSNDLLKKKDKSPTEKENRAEEKDNVEEEEDEGERRGDGKEEHNEENFKGSPIISLIYFAYVISYILCDHKQKAKIRVRFSVSEYLEGESRGRISSEI